ncbi:MAG: NifU family protein [Planctomycetaceae bacterium]|nr:NifU family protein [Planctomycetaceae bacterium]
MADEAGNQTIDTQVGAVIDRIRPMLQADGGDIELVGVDNEGVVSVKLQGACKGCPGAKMTLKMGVERHLKQQVPGVTKVIAVED